MGSVSSIVPYLGLPSGQRQLMIGEPVASARDLQRYKEQLLERQRQLSSVQDDLGARVPAAGGLEGDLIDEANAEAELQIRLHNRRSSLKSYRRGSRSDQAGHVRNLRRLQSAYL